MLGNPIKYIDPDGRSPIYNTEGNFLGTDNEGLQGIALIMDEENFYQGMSHENALKHNKGSAGFANNEAKDRFLNHFRNLRNRPDYDGFVTISEGVDWAKNNVGALDNPTPENMLYIDATQLDFGNIAINMFTNINEPEPRNLFTLENLDQSPLNSRLRATVYALGRVNMILLDRSSGQVRIVNDFNLEDGRATDYDWNRGGTWRRRAFINAERFRAGVNDTHGFRTYYYGTGSLNQ